MERNSISYKTILGEGNYRKLIFSAVIDRFGDSVDAIAFTWLVYQITHNAMWSAIVFALNMLPNVVVQPFAGAVVEKLNKKRVIIAAYTIRAAVIAVFAILYMLGLVNALVMAGFALVITTVESFSLPASSAFTAQIIKKEHLACGVSLSTILTSAAALVGTGIAGVVIAAWGALPAMIIDISTFVIASVLLLMVKNTEISQSGADDTAKEAAGSGIPNDPSRKFTRLFSDGMRYVVNTPVVRNFCVLCVVLNFILVPINALQAPIVEEIFGMGSELLSFAGMSASFGGIAGAALMPVFLRKFSPLQTVCIGTAILGLGLAGIAMGRIVSGNAVLCCVAVSACFFAGMLAATLIGSLLGVQFMRSVDREYLARASAVFNAFSTAAMPIGSLLVSVLVTRVTTDRIILFGSILTGIVLIVIMITRPVLGKREETADAT